MNDIEVQSQLIKEELVRQIRDAVRWSAVREAWEALLKVSLMSTGLIREQEMFFQEPKLGQRVKL